MCLPIFCFHFVTIFLPVSLLIFDHRLANGWCVLVAQLIEQLVLLLLLVCILFSCWLVGFHTAIIDQMWVKAIYLFNDIKYTNFWGQHFFRFVLFFLFMFNIFFLLLFFCNLLLCVFNNHNAKALAYWPTWQCGTHKHTRSLANIF